MLLARTHHPTRRGLNGPVLKQIYFASEPLLKEVSASTRYGLRSSLFENLNARNQICEQAPYRPLKNGVQLQLVILAEKLRIGGFIEARR